MILTSVHNGLLTLKNKDRSRFIKLEKDKSYTFKDYHEYKDFEEDINVFLGSKKLMKGSINRPSTEADFFKEEGTEEAIQEKDNFEVIVDSEQEAQERQRLFKHFHFLTKGNKLLHSDISTEDLRRFVTKEERKLIK